jgi:hypothetical protein
LRRRPRPFRLRRDSGQRRGRLVRSGFLLGLWHGFIFPVAWIVSLFVSKVAVYAVPNNGGWYDFGYFLGIVVFGVGARKSQIVYRDRNVIDVKAKRVEEVQL